jgi:hypothetical protein
MTDITFTIDETMQNVHETRPEERPIVPVGTHRLTIRAAEVGPNEYRTHERNPDGICLKLRLELDRDHKLIFDDLPQHQPWRGAQLGAALGLQAEGNTLRVSPDVVSGQTVYAMVEHYTSKAGKTSAVVKKYLPQPDRHAAKPPVARTPAAKVKAAAPEITSDDIPFLWVLPLVASIASQVIA